MAIIGQNYELLFSRQRNRNVLLPLRHHWSHQLSVLLVYAEVVADTTWRTLITISTAAVVALGRVVITIHVTRRETLLALYAGSGLVECGTCLRVPGLSSMVSEKLDNFVNTFQPKGPQNPEVVSLLDRWDQKGSERWERCGGYCVGWFARASPTQTHTSTCTYTTNWGACLSPSYIDTFTGFSRWRTIIR